MTDGKLMIGEGLVAGDGGRKRDGNPTVVKADDFTTHGVIVGMTGSGKTGLGVVLLEEVLAQGVPALIIDPKGDLANMALLFPDLSGTDFEPWVDEAEARKNGMDRAAWAGQVAKNWRDGLATWNLGPADVKAQKDCCDIAVYTPGSTAGIGLNLVGSLDAPSGGDVESAADEIEGFVSGILSLVGIDADPLSSREHILLSNLIANAWAQGQNLDLPTLVGQVATPPIRKMGVFDLEQFYPSKDRTALAMRLNGLLASASFGAWANGVPIDFDALFHRNGKPSAAVISIAHLSDEERQFVVSLLLGKLITWMRRQSGTTGLRAMVYMDEVAGYVPPSAMPPSKKPILTLMKQARAFGVGMVLASQNPVDVDYKGLSNAGTWMIGRLQTERDKARLMEGLSAADGSVDINETSVTISSLGKREFLLRTPGGKPGLFTTRWAKSYLGGPMTREQIGRLMAGAPEKSGAPAPSQSGSQQPPAEQPASPQQPPTQPAPSQPTPSQPAPAPAQEGSAPAQASFGDAQASGHINPAGAQAAAQAGQILPAQTPAAAPMGDDETPVAPAVAEGIPVRYLDPAAPWLGEVGANPQSSRLSPAVACRVNLLFDDERAGLREQQEYEVILHPLTAGVDVAAGTPVDYDDRDLVDTPPAGARYVLSDAPLTNKTFWTGLQRNLVTHLVASKTLQLQKNGPLKLFSRIGETPEQFADRCRVAAADLADAEAAKLRGKYQDRIDRASDALAQAQDRVAIEQQNQASRRNEELISGAGAVLGAFLGGKRNVGSIAGRLARGAGSAVGRRGRTGAAGQRAEAAANRVQEKQDALTELENDLADELTRINDDWFAKGSEIESLDVPLEKTDVTVTQLVMCWLPVN